MNQNLFLYYHSFYEGTHRFIQPTNEKKMPSYCLIINYSFSAAHLSISCCFWDLVCDWPECVCICVCAFDHLTSNATVHRSLIAYVPTAFLSFSFVTSLVCECNNVLLSAHGFAKIHSLNNQFIFIDVLALLLLCGVIKIHTYERTFLHTFTPNTHTHGRNGHIICSGGRMKWE